MEPLSKPTITQDEINCLPRWARVAFATRCARRMFDGLRDYVGNDVPPEHFEFFEKVISLGEESSQSGYPIEELEETIKQAEVVRTGVLGPAHGGYGEMETVPRGRRLFSHIAKLSILAARAALENDANWAFRTWELANEGAPEFNSQFVLSEIRNDFDSLKEGAKLKAWNDESPIPRKYFAQWD